MTDEYFRGRNLPAECLLNVPTADTNGDGFPDIFDTSLAFSGSSSGTFSFPGFFARGNVTASWSRQRRVRMSGNCQLNFQGSDRFLTPSKFWK